MKWLRKAAEQGYAKAQWSLGSRYELGQGVPRDAMEMVRWYRKAAEQGNADAQLNMGVCYGKGEGVEKNDVEAAKWYRKAADQGEADAQYELGLLYGQGKGVAKDYVEGYKWWLLSAGQGNELAKKNMPSLENLMSREQTAEGQALARNFKPREATTKRKETGNSEGADMVMENGVLKVPVQINGAISLKFVVDSGASDVQIPKDVFLTLIRAETIKESDYRPGKTFVLANGSKVKSDRFILRSMKVGESTYLDVEASVGGFDAPLLLGQSFLSKFGEWKIDNKNAKLILTK
jgi:TPR repeat protein